MKKWIKNIIKIIVIAIGILLLLLLLLRLPFIQTFIVGKISKALSTKMQTTLTLERVNINFIDHVSLEGIYLEDQNKDTLLYAGNLEVDIAIFKLLRKEINIESILLEKSIIRIHQLGDSTFNFSFIIDAFASEDTTSAPFPFNIQLGRIEILNADYSFNVLKGKNRIQFEKLLVKAKEIDINTLFFDIAKIELDAGIIESTWDDFISEVSVTVLDTTTSNISFPLSTLPISVKCDELNVRNTKGYYLQGDIKAEDHFNYKRIVVEDLNLSILNLSLTDSLLNFKIQNSGLCLNNNKELKNFNAEGVFSPLKLSLSSEPWTFNESQFDFNVEANYASFNDLVKLNPKAQLKIKTKDLKIAIADVIYFIPGLDTIKMIHRLRNETLKLNTDLQGRLEVLNVGLFDLQTANTTLKLEGVIKNISKIDEIQVEDLDVKLKTNITELRMILGDEILTQNYNRFGTINLDAKLTGSLAKVYLAKLNVQSDGDLRTSLTGTVKDLTNIDLLSYNLNIRELSTSYFDVLAISNALPELLKSFDFISYQGLATGTIRTFDIDGLLKSSLGNVDADLYLAFNQDYSDASYNGKIDVMDFQLGKLLNNDSLGTLSLQADLDGQGLSLETIDADLDVNVSAFSFNSYLYKNLVVQGHLVQKEFEGVINIDDENLALDFQGVVNLQDTLPEFNFEAKLKRFNTQALKLTSFPLSVSLNMNSKLIGKTIDEIEGNLVINNIQLANDKNTWTTDSIVFEAVNELGKGRAIHLNSAFLNVDLEGKFSISNLPKMFLAFGDQHFPFSSLIGADAKGDAYSDSTLQSMKGEQVSIQATARDLPALATFFNIDLKRLDSVSLFLNLDGPNKLLDFEFYIPSIDYKDFHVDSIYMLANTANGNLIAKFSIDSASYRDFAYIPGLALNAEFKDQIAYVRTYIENDTGSYSLDLNTELYSEQSAVGIRLIDPLMLNTRLWEITQTGSLLLGDSGVVLPEVQIRNGTQELAFSSAPNEYNLNFTDFDLNNLLELVEIDSFLAKGQLNGFLKINSGSNATAFEGDLTLSNFAVNDSEIGDLKVEASLIDNIVQAQLNLIGSENRLNGNFSYNIDNTDLNGQIKIEKFYLPSYEAFVKNYATNLEGFLYGTLTISGKTDAPEFSGNVNFNGAKAFVKDAGTTYGIGLGYLEFSDKILRPNLTFVDEENRQATLTGTIEHNLFKDINFKMNLTSEAFTFLNSQKNPEALFYGKFIASTNLIIEGNLALPKIRGKLTTMPESDITVQLLSEKAIATQESYVIFLDGADYSLEEIDSIANERYKISTSIDMSLLIDINDKTILNLIIDPITGDRLAVQGNGQLTVKIPPKGDLDITGIYTVTSGQYNFSFQKLLKRKFEIVKGSQISFSGNPMNARLDIKAAYKTEASTYALVEGQASSLSQEEEREIKKKQEVSVELVMGGKLAEPELSFDIKLENTGDSPIGSAAKRSLDQLKQNESELYKQVFSLLLFNSFSGSSTSSNISSTGSSTAVRSVGNLISSQLNRLASKAEGLQINFDLDQYQDQLSETNEQITEIDLGISQSLLNDRLVISVGGNVDLESGNQDKNSLGNLAGDFVIEYKLTEDGKYNVRVFQKSDYDALNDASLWKTGVGFSYQTKFGKLMKKKGGKE